MGFTIDASALDRADQEVVFRFNDVKVFAALSLEEDVIERKPTVWNYAAGKGVRLVDTNNGRTILTIAREWLAEITIDQLAADIGTAVRAARDNERTGNRADGKPQSLLDNE